ncbi:MAG: uL30 family ribosomal protein [Candidatus Nanoarchaeia archaeon]
MAENNLICIVRVHGKIGLKKSVNETLNRLKLRRKYSCIVLINPKKEMLGMVKSVRNFTAFGNLDKSTFKKLLESRGQVIDKSKKIEADKVITELEKSKKYEELNLKGFFRLHPPRKGINSKSHFPKGVLGDNGKEINKLIERML